MTQEQQGQAENQEQMARTLIEADRLANQQLATFLEDAKVRLGKYVDHTVNILHKIIAAQSSELLILHTLESLIRNNQITEEVMIEILLELQALRVRTQEAARAEAVAEAVSRKQ